MAKSYLARKSRKRGRAGVNKTKLAILIGAIAAISIAVFLTGTRSSNSAYASPPVNQKRYKATRAIVVDRETGQQRLPNQEEIDEVVSQLSALAARPEDLPQTPTANGSVTVDLAGGYGGVMLARPGDSGNWETKCVFSFEEGAEFLGLVEDSAE